MTPRGANQPSVGGFNQSVILDQIRRSGGLSRVELAALTGLSAQTVSNITQRLLDAGIVAEAGRTSVTPGPGKPRTTLRLAPGSRFAVGVHLDPSIISFVLLGIDGEVVAARHRPTPDANDPERTERLITAELERLIADSGVDRSRIVGVGIAAPGPIDAERGVVVDPPNLGGWHRVPLRDAVAAATGFPVVLDKDVTAAAVGERWVSAATARSFAFLYLGTGLGVGLMVSDDIVRGGSGNAGEIGHIVADPDGVPCACGLRGCVAVSCTPAALVAEAESLGILPAGRTAADPFTIDLALTELVARAATDAAADALLRRAADHVARALSVVCNLLDVDRVVLGGPAWRRLAPWYATGIPAALDELRVARGLHDVRVSGTALGDDVGAIGAACLVLDEALTPRPTSLLLN
ncbi:ROK family transcriptional regulator [Microbacterium sp. zg.Y1090]|uniref:ROK family transcriptional regulator n=1 Tax=Microbacterium TaxID=33882 RepID=UPI00214B1165|nr:MULTISPECIES: ROK family transcriptional regulator [unclassified Microbacterium]MCR2812668.1 ROK family transcriptional regulator [Microbacterium sp. zg.Y1084]MCR2817536.1 ROK family transcriptional regulator [Microbacterium sp. zg.Y1090]MDL5485821.1 ROK family transcriptional regulator [Microbacterium sp. zg-Y1211]WIM28982.1 ROK family transcriptional regulator [Microbacterium sp. zg-Y1090]